MKQQVRELLVTAKVAQTWQGQFDEKVEELMLLVSKADTLKQVQGAAELLDVYHKRKLKSAKLNRKKGNECCDKPFEFVVFRN